MGAAARRSTAQHGAISPALALVALALVLMVLGAVSVGRVAAYRADVQRAADAAVLAAAQVVRERGLPFDGTSQAAAENIAQGNSGEPIAFVWQVTETATSLDVTVRASIEVSVPVLIFSSGRREVSAVASGRLSQTRIDEAERRIPKLVLVLDYSGSMNQRLPGDPLRAIDRLEQSVAALLGAGLMIDYGGVFYSTNVFQAVSISATAPDQIINIMNNYGAGGTTNTGAALNRAGNILTATENTGYHVLLVSDGAPCCGSNAFQVARQAAHNLWNQDITIFSLEIRHAGSSAALAQFMTYVAGTPANPHDPNYHFVATTAAELVDQFQSIVANIVCKAGPIAPAPADVDSVRVFLSRGGDERSLPWTDDLVADKDIEAFQYEPGDQTVRLTVRACDAVIDAGDEIVVRYDRPGLTQ